MRACPSSIRRFTSKDGLTQTPVREFAVDLCTPHRKASIQGSNPKSARSIGFQSDASDVKMLRALVGQRILVVNDQISST